MDGATLGTGRLLARLFEHDQVVGDSGLCDAGPVGKRADVLLTFAQEVLEDASAGGVGKSSQNLIWRPYINRFIAHGLFIARGL